MALGVLAAAVLLAVQSTRTIFLPHRAPAPFTLAVLLTVVAVKETLFRYVVRFGRSIESIAVEADAWRHRADVLTSLAAFIGISIALIGGEKWRSADNWAAIFVCLIIATIGVRLLGPALHDILDTAPRGEIIDLVRKAAAFVPRVIEIDKCLVRKMGLDFYVDLHVKVDGSISGRPSHRASSENRRSTKRPAHCRCACSHRARAACSLAAQFLQKRDNCVGQRLAGLTDPTREANKTPDIARMFQKI